MTLPEILLLVALALVVIALQLIGSEVSQSRLVQRVRGVQPDSVQAEPQQNITALGGVVLRQLAVAGIVKALAPPKDRAQVERLLAPRGVPVALAGPLLVALKLVCLIGGTLLGLVYHVVLSSDGKIVLPVVFGVAAGILVPSTVLSRLRKRHIESLTRGLPDALDLLVVCTEAGLGLESAIDRVSTDLRQAAPGLALEFAQLSQEMRMLPDRSIAMDRFAERAEVDGLRRLASTLAQAMRYGTPLSQALRALAGDQRNERVMRLEAKAQRLPALLVLPLVMFILPPLFIILAGPNFLRLAEVIGNF